MKLDNINSIDDIEKEVDKLLTKEDGKLELGRAIASHCYDNLSDKNKGIYDEMILQFNDITEEEICSGLSVIFMDYPSYNIKSYEGIIKEHSKLFENWSPDRVEKWVALRMSDDYNIN